MTRNDSPQRFSMPGVVAAMVPFVVLRGSPAEEDWSGGDAFAVYKVVRRGVQASRRRGAVEGGLSG